MSGADLPIRPMAPSSAARSTTLRDGRMMTDGANRRRPAPSTRHIARRALMVSLTKWSLPLLALVLLCSIALWPEIARVKEQGRTAMRRAFQVDPESGRMQEPRYRGVDQRGRPYTVTAASGRQTSAERIALVDPKGDLVTENGTWLMAQSKQGVFIQHQSLMDMSDDVSLYREDGTVLQTDSAALDLKAGAASSMDKTHAEGPFGTLDAQGFALVEKGAVIQFQGRSHLVLNSSDGNK